MKKIIILFFITLFYSCNKNKNTSESKIYYADVIGFSHNRLDSNFCFLYLDLNRDSIFDNKILFEEKIFKSYYEKTFFYQASSIPTLLKVKHFLSNDSIAILEMSDYSFDNEHHCNVFFSDTTFVFNLK